MRCWLCQVAWIRIQILMQIIYVPKTFQLFLNILNTKLLYKERRWRKREQTVDTQRSEKKVSLTKGGKFTKK